MVDVKFLVAQLDLQTDPDKRAEIQRWVSELIPPLTDITSGNSIVFVFLWCSPDFKTYCYAYFLSKLPARICRWIDAYEDQSSTSDDGYSDWSSVEPESDYSPEEADQDNKCNGHNNDIVE